jgi:hypothetical protein
VIKVLGIVLGVVVAFMLALRLLFEILRRRKTPPRALDDEKVRALAARWLAGEEDVHLRVVDMAGESPEDLWAVLLALVELSTSEEDLRNVAAGPFESLLIQRGPAFNERVRHVSHANEKFRRMAGFAYLSRKQRERFLSG